MPGLFDDDFIYGALGRARNPIADFLEQATPARGSGITNYAGATPASGLFGADDFRGTSTRAASTLANYRALKAENEAATAKAAEAKKAPATAAAAQTPARAVAAVTGNVPALGLEGINVTNLGPTQRAEFFKRAMALGTAVEEETGIPAELMAAIVASESNFGNVPNPTLFGIKAAPGQQATSYSTPEGAAAGGNRIENQSFRTYDNSLDAFRGFVRFLEENPRYGNAMTQFRNGQIDGRGLALAMNAAGYAEDRTWAQRLTIPLMQEAATYRDAGQQLRQDTANQALDREGQIAMANRPRGTSQNDLGLPPNIAAAFCGPAAAIEFVRQTGRDPTVQEALNLARAVGWNENGMNGPTRAVNLINRLGGSAVLGNVDEPRIRAEVQAGRPIIIDTLGHYYQLIGYNEATGGYVMGDAVGRRAGANGLPLDRLGTLGYGPARSAIYMNTTEGY
jgi:flagellum-specific peptidoglycan hydrolase FlgJ